MTLLVGASDVWILVNPMDCYSGTNENDAQEASDALASSAHSQGGPFSGAPILRMSLIRGPSLTQSKHHIDVSSTHQSYIQIELPPKSLQACPRFRSFKS